MRLQILLTLFAIFCCDAKLPRFRPYIAPNDLPTNLQNSQQQIEIRNNKTSRIVEQYKTRRSRRTTFNSKSFESSLVWAHSERLDENGDVVLRWVTSDSSITFRVEARTKGYVGIGFNSGRNMMGADLVIAWVDDYNGNAQVLVSIWLLDTKLNTAYKKQSFREVIAICRGEK